MNTEIRLLKLTNGEDIIAYVNETPESYHLDNPLLMRIHSRPTKHGIQEGLHLSRWVQPFSEETNFSIMRQHVVLSTEVSDGLNRYYEYSVKSFEREEYEKGNPEILGPSDEELEEIMEEEEENFLLLDSPSKAIH
tara:strand:+ start:177 stop:584 length:408 start_codon:yes stop_codon:yes gene_type:complete